MRLWFNMCLGGICAPPIYWEWRCVCVWMDGRGGGLPEIEECCVARCCHNLQRATKTISLTAGGRLVPTQPSQLYRNSFMSQVESAVSACRAVLSCSAFPKVHPLPLGVPFSPSLSSRHKHDLRNVQGREKKNTHNYVPL